MNTNEIVPFGKYKGQPVEVMVNDHQYVQWLMQQDWFNSRYQSIKMIIVNNFHEPTETPEHNKLQCLFLDDSFCQKFLDLLLNRDKPFSEWSTGGGPYKKYYHTEYIFHSIQLEHNGIDVLIHGTIKLDNTERESQKWGIEIKPSLGDDYPAVLRQMKNNKSNVLFIDQYSGTGATYEQMVKVFKISFISVVKLSEL